MSENQRTEVVEYSQNFVDFTLEDESRRGVNGGIIRDIFHDRPALMWYEDDEEEEGESDIEEESELLEIRRPEVGVGMSFGNSTCCVGVWTNDGVEIIPNEYGNKVISSCVAFTETECLVGDSAMEQALSSPENTIYGILRFLGLEYENEEVQNIIRISPYKIVNKDGHAAVEVMFKGEKTVFEPTQIIAMILEHLKHCAEEYLGKDVVRVVISVPTHFDGNKRQLIKDSCGIAGLEVMRIINEASSASVAYGLDRSSSMEQRNVIVFDLGGYRLDVTALMIEEGIFEVLATSTGSIGGVDFDNRLIEYFCEYSNRRYKNDLKDDEIKLRRLRYACEHTKKVLSSANRTSISLDDFVVTKDDQEGNTALNDFVSQVSRKKFEVINHDLFVSCLKHIKEVLAISGLEKSQINDVVFCGGSSKIPKIQDLIREFFYDTNENITFNKKIPPDEAIANGATIYSAILCGSSTTVTYLESIQLEVLERSIGVETVGGVMTKIIRSNKTIPFKRSKTFTTCQDDQPGVVVKLFMGERELAEDNDHIKTIRLRDILRLPRGMSKIEIIVWTPSENARLFHVSVKDIGSGRMKKTSFRNKKKNRTEPDEIDEKIHDIIKLDVIKAKNKLESFCFQIKNFLNMKKNVEVIEDERIRYLELVENTLLWLKLPYENNYEVYEDKRIELEEKIVLQNDVLWKFYSDFESESGGSFWNVDNSGYYDYNRGRNVQPEELTEYLDNHVPTFDDLDVD